MTNGVAEPLSRLSDNYEAYHFLTPYKIKKSFKKICVFDCETDPFEYGVSVKPFTCGFYDGEVYEDFWGDNCIEQFAEYILSRKDEHLLIYAHNLGGFDGHFITHWFDEHSKPLIIHGKICQVRAFEQEWRDSFKILPVPLKQMQKEEFDYVKNKREVREQHREEILHYQMSDCINLYKPIMLFHDTFGDRITIGNTAINMLKSFHHFEELNDKQDDVCRQYFYGGRTQAFEKGVLEDDFNVYDVNSMYPFVMAEYQHPVGNTIIHTDHITDYTAFLTVVGKNYNAFAKKGKLGELNFTEEYGEFNTTIHEYNTAVELGMFETEKIVTCVNVVKWTNFKKYVHHFYKLRLEAAANGDELLKLFYKLLLNNAYGKFAQDGRKYMDYTISMRDAIPDGGAYHPVDNQTGWSPAWIHDYGIIWQRQSQRPAHFYNVATGASITGAARAELMRGIHGAGRPVYCDTDSLICRSIDRPVGSKDLGAWKWEASGTKAAIAGKKMYALFDGDREVKKASKGVGLSALEILEVAKGNEVTYNPMVPTFKLDGTQTFTPRTIRMT